MNVLADPVFQRPDMVNALMDGSELRRVGDLVRRRQACRAHFRAIFVGITLARCTATLRRSVVDVWLDINVYALENAIS